MSTLLKHIAGASLGVLIGCCLVARADASETAPAPTPTRTPLFTYTGDLRAFYFGRTNGNTCLTCKTKGQPDATAFNTSALLHGQLNLPDSPFSLGATYFGAFPWGVNAPGPLNSIGYNPEIDNTLPGYALSLWGEYYVQYKTKGTLFQTGREVINTPWANSGDSRMAPEAFQGTLISTNVSPELTLSAMYMARFRSRVTSAFNSNTLLTSCNTATSTGKGPVAGVTGTFTVPGDPCNHQQTTAGFVEGSAVYTIGKTGFNVGAYEDEVIDIADLTWLTAQYSFDRSSTLKPYLAGQYLAENQAGSALVGSLHTHVEGGQFGATVYHNLNLTISYDGSTPSASVVSSKICKGTASSPTAAAPNVVFGGVADTTNKSVPAGDVMCYSGGVAAPYTEGQASDPLWSTSLTQGMADVHKPGNGIKAALAWQTQNGRLHVYSSQAWYDYSLPGANGAVNNADYRAEFDFDVQYFLNPVIPGHRYRGLSIRQRYGDRTQTFSPYDFKYSRTQLEYTF
jgi:hypothetical protein